MGTMIIRNTLYRRVAKKVLSDTLSVRKGEAITVESWNNGLEFARALVAEARALGCTTSLLLEDEEAYIEGLSRSPKDRVGAMGDNEYGMLEGTDAYVFIPGPLLAAYQTRVKPPLMTESTKYNGSWYEAAEKAKLRGARLTFGYIGEEMANIMGRTVQEVVGRQLNAALVNFSDISKSAHKLSSPMADGSEAVLSAGSSRLEFNLKGETTVEDGIVSRSDVESGNNMTYVPPGFVTGSTEPASVSGTVRVSNTLTRLGLLRDATLTFREGKLAKCESRGNMEMLTKLIEAVPEDRRKLAIFNVGINPKMGYLFGQDRMVAGSVTVGGFGFMAVVRGADFKVAERLLVNDGKLQV